MPLNDCAIIVNSKDNVAVVKTELVGGTEVELPDQRIVRLTTTVPPGHRFAIRGISKGQYVRQYGQPIGTSLGIEEGDWVTHDNMSNDVPIVRDLPEDLHTPAPDYFTSEKAGTFSGFRRPDGRVGTRNYILLVPTSMCASHEVQQISTLAEFTLYKRDLYPNVDGVVAIPHNKGCGCNDGSNVETLMRTLANYADHPNVGGVILVELGCEKTNLTLVDKYLS